MMLAVALGFGTASSAIINGILVDSKDTTELMQANVALLQATKDSTYVTSTVTDFNGVFNLENVQPGHYYLKCSYIGYDDVVKRVSIGDDGRDVNMGMIALSQNTIVLKETVVMGVKTPITVKEDTIEYNADTYKTRTLASVEAECSYFSEILGGYDRDRRSSSVPMVLYTTALAEALSEIEDEKFVLNSGGKDRQLWLKLNPEPKSSADKDKQKPEK